LINHLKIDDKGIAIAVNFTVIQKSDWGKTKLKENDNITIIKATQGG
jgi:sulfur carrier protein